MSKKMWGSQIKEELAELADSNLEYGERSDMIRRLAKIIAHEGHSERTPYDAAIQQKEDKIKEKKKKIDELYEDVHRLEDDVEAIKAERSQYDSVEERLEGALSVFEKDLRTGQRVWPGHAEVQEIADDYDISPDVVVERLKERNPDIPSHAFTKYHAHADDHRSKQWDGLRESLASLPLEERECTGGSSD